MSNKVELEYFDKHPKHKMGCGIAIINDTQRISLSIMDSDTEYDEKNFQARRNYFAKVAHDFNISSPFYLEARTLKGLLGKIKRYKYNLVRP